MKRVVRAKSGSISRQEVVWCAAEGGLWRAVPHPLIVGVAKYITYNWIKCKRTRAYVQGDYWPRRASLAWLRAN